MSIMLGEGIEAMVKDEVSRWASQILQRSVEVHVADELDDVKELMEDRDRSDTMVIAWTEFDEMSKDDFYRYIDELNDANAGVWVEGHHPDGDKSDLFEMYEGHVADDYAIFFVHNVELLGERDA